MTRLEPQHDAPMCKCGKGALMPLSEAVPRWVLACTRTALRVQLDPTTADGIRRITQAWRCIGAREQQHATAQRSNEVESAQPKDELRCDFCPANATYYRNTTPPTAACAKCYDEHLAPRNGAPRVYIAGSSKHTDRARILANQLECRGILPTERWWDVIDADRAVGVADGDLGPTAARRCAEADLAGIDAADVLVLMPLPKSHGALLETGYALAKGKPVIQLGSAGHIWEHLPGVIVAQAEHPSEVAAGCLGKELSHLIRDLRDADRLRRGRHVRSSPSADVERPRHEELIEDASGLPWERQGHRAWVTTWNGCRVVLTQHGAHLDDEPLPAATAEALWQATRPSPSLLDTPRMSGEQWIVPTEDECDAWPFWQCNVFESVNSPRVLTSYEVKLARTDGCHYRPLRLPGMNERGEVAGVNMTDEHLARTEWQVLEPHGDVVGVPKWYGVPSRTNDVKAALAGRRDRTWRPAIWAQLDESPDAMRQVEKEPPPLNRKELGANLRKRREELGISPSSAANGAGMNNASQWLAVEDGRIALDNDQWELCWDSLDLDRDEAGFCHADYSRWFQRLAVEFAHPGQYQAEELSGLVDELITAGYGPKNPIAMLAESVVERAGRGDASDLEDDTKLLSRLRSAIARIGNGEPWPAQYLVNRAIADGELWIDKAERAPVDPDPLVLGGQFYASEIHAMADEAERLDMAGKGLRALRLLSRQGITDVAHRLDWTPTRVGEIERAAMEPATTGELVALMRCLADMLEASDGDE